MFRDLLIAATVLTGLAASPAKAQQIYLDQANLTTGGNYDYGVYSFFDGTNWKLTVSGFARGAPGGPNPLVGIVNVFDNAFNVSLGSGMFTADQITGDFSYDVTLDVDPSMYNLDPVTISIGISRPGVWQTNGVYCFSAIYFSD